MPGGLPTSCPKKHSVPSLHRVVPVKFFHFVPAKSSEAKPSLRSPFMSGRLYCLASTVSAADNDYVGVTGTFLGTASQGVWSTARLDFLVPPGGIAKLHFGAFGGSISVAILAQAVSAQVARRAQETSRCRVVGPLSPKVEAPRVTRYGS